MLKLIKNTTKTLLFMFGFILILQATLFVNAAGDDPEGFGVSGSFAGYHYKLVPDEVFESSKVNVIFFNNYSEEIEVDLLMNTPVGVEIELLDSRITIPANTTYTFPIKMTTSADVTPGDYVISVAAEVVPKEISGIQIVGSAELSANLSVYGFAGSMNIETTTPSGAHFDSEINVYRMEDDTMTPIGDSNTGEYEDRVVPGVYYIEAWYNGKLVSEETVTINDKDELNIILKAQTVFITSFLVGPNINEETGKLVSAEIAFSLENIFTDVEPAQVILEVWYDDELIDSNNIYYSNTIEVGDTSGRNVFIPSKGWKAGNYTYILKVLEVNDNEAIEAYVHAESNPLTYAVPRDLVGNSLVFWIIGGVVAIIAGGSIFFFFIYVRDNDDEKEKKKQPSKTTVYKRQSPTKKKTTKPTTIDRIPFDQKLKDSEQKIKDNYKEIREYILGFNNTRSNLGVSGETFFIGKVKIAKITLVQKSLKIHMKAEIGDYPDNIFHQKDFGHLKTYQDIPFTIRINSNISKRNIKKVLDQVIKDNSK